jgi:hypothetical protein
VTDRELLELAAKAAGVKFDCFDSVFFDENGKTWNPLTDDGDALRLAVKLELIDQVGVSQALDYWLSRVQVGFDPYAATRRAIVRAVAEIGRTM